MGSRHNLELSQVCPLKEVDWRSHFSISADVSKNGFWVTWFTHAFFSREVIPQKKSKRAALVTVRTKLRNWLTCSHILLTYMLILVSSMQWKLKANLSHWNYCKQKWGNHPVFYFSLLLKRKYKNFVVFDMLLKGNFLS